MIGHLGIVCIRDPCWYKDNKMLHHHSLAKIPKERLDLKLQTESFYSLAKKLHLGPDPDWICTVLDGLGSHLLLPSLQFLVKDPASPRKLHLTSQTHQSSPVSRMYVCHYVCLCTVYVYMSTVYMYSASMYVC